MNDIVLSIAIVNWNTSQMTSDCIRSILENTKGINYEVIVVDNASTDDSVRMIETNFPQVKLIRNNKNLMFAEPNNQALEVSLGKYFLLLNSDTIIHRDALEKMAGFLDLHQETGAVTCTLLNSDGSIQYNMHRRFPSFLRLSFGYLYKHCPKVKTRWSREYLMLDNNFDHIQKIEQAAGTCIMIRKDIIHQIGGLFDAKRFPLYYNDVDLCYRLHKKGFDIYLISSALITHLKGKSIRKVDSSKNRTELSVSNLNYFKKHKKYLDYILSKTAYSLLFLSLVLYSVGLLCLRRISFATFKGRYLLFLSVLLDKKIGSH